jgi:hypothetical protein
VNLKRKTHEKVIMVLQFGYLLHARKSKPLLSIHAGKRYFRAAGFLLGAVVLAWANAAMAASSVKVGLLSTLSGPGAGLGVDFVMVFNWRSNSMAASSAACRLK